MTHFGRPLIAFMAFGQSASDRSSHAHLIGLIDEDGAGERYPDFGLSDQISWQFGPRFNDGRRNTRGTFGLPGRRTVRRCSSPGRGWAVPAKYGSWTKTAETSVC